MDGWEDGWVVTGMRNMMRSLLLTASGCLILAIGPRHVSATAGVAAGQKFPSHWNGHKVIRALNTDFMRPGVRLEVIDTSPPGYQFNPVPFDLQISWGKHRRRPVRLNDLRGYVKIRTATQALSYVRLSEDAMIRFQDQPGYGVEVISVDALPKSSIGVVAALSQSGSGGVLSRQAHQAGGFHAPTFKKTAHGFVIDRWIFDDEPFRLRMVREYVGFDGRYRRVTIKLMRHPPKLPHNRWMIPDIK